MPPTVNLSYGQSGDAVKQLQNFLIGQGLSIPAGATGYFGDQTKAALLQWQNQMGVKAPAADLGSNWGPLSIAAAASVNSSKTPTGLPAVGGSSGSGAAASSDGSATPQYTVGQTVTGGSANSDGSVKYTYTYLGNGQWSQSDTLGRQYPGITKTTDQVAPAVTTAQQTAGQVTPPTGSGESATPTRTAATPEETAALNGILNDPNLTADMKAVIKSVYDATVTGDAARASRVVSAMKAASEYSDPYFKAQITLATDALQRGISGKDGDLAFQENQLKDALKTLTENTGASKDQLSFEHAQELKQLQQKYETDLSTTQDNLANAGFTSSSKRARAEQILGDNNSGLVESSNKQFGYQTGNLDRTLQSSGTSTAAQIENLQRLAQEGKLDLYRQTEAKVGSSNLPGLDGLSALGGIGGEIPRQQANDSFSFASNFVF